MESQPDAGEMMLRESYAALMKAACRVQHESQKAIVTGRHDLLFAVTGKSLAVLSMVCGTYRAPDENAQVLLELVTQMLSSASAAMLLLMSGYCRQSFAVQRHMLETGFLLDLFRSDESELHEWLKYRDNLKTVGFRVKTVTKKLDARDNLPAESRLDSYRAVSNLAVHPFAIGLRIPQRERPFFDKEAFLSALEELSWHLPYFTLLSMEALPGARAIVPDEALVTFDRTVARWQRRCHRQVAGGVGSGGLCRYAQLIWGQRQRCSESKGEQA